MFSLDGCQQDAVVLTGVGKLLDIFVYSCGHGYSQIMFNLSRIPPCFCGVYYENTERASRCEAEEQSSCVASVLLDRIIPKWLPGEQENNTPSSMKTLSVMLGTPGLFMELFLAHPRKAFMLAKLAIPSLS